MSTEKDLFFNNLNTSLAEKYNTSDSFIRVIRFYALYHRHSPRDIQDRCIRKFDLPRYGGKIRKKGKTRIDTRTHKKKYYNDLFQFIERCSKTEWEDITQKTIYDRNQ